MVENTYQFDKKPFVSISHSIDDSAPFGKPLKFNAVDKSIIYDSFSFSRNNFFGSIMVQWSPL
jgi:hypothetical protein